MIKQQAITGTPKQLQFPWWKRLMLVTALLLSGGPLTVMASTQAAHASPTSQHQHTHSKPKEQDVITIVITCNPGNGGNGVKSIKKSKGAEGGRGGDCVVTIPIKVLLTVKNNMTLTGKNKVTLKGENKIEHADNVVTASAVLER
jgi:hypothetical protein